MSSIRRRLLVVVVATGAVALAAPVSGASAQMLPVVGVAAGGNQIGTAGCVGTNRPSIGGNTGSTSDHTCGAVVSLSGPQIGQISSVIAPRISGSPFARVNVSAGSITRVAA